MDVTELGAFISPVEGITGIISTGSEYVPAGSHTDLIQRDSADQHPISAITGLQEALSAKGTYSKPSGGIPVADLSAAVQSSLEKADSALQTHQSLADYQPRAVNDAGGFFITGTVETVLQEIGAALCGKQNSAITRTVTIAAADWLGSTVCTKSVPGVTAANTVICDSSDSSVQCVLQGAGTLTFTAERLPASAVNVKVVILP